MGCGSSKDSIKPDEITTTYLKNMECVSFNGKAASVKAMRYIKINKKTMMNGKKVDLTFGDISDNSIVRYDKWFKDSGKTIKYIQLNM